MACLWLSQRKTSNMRAVRAFLVDAALFILFLFALALARAWRWA